MIAIFPNIFKLLGTPCRTYRTSFKTYRNAEAAEQGVQGRTVAPPPFPKKISAPHVSVPKISRAKHKIGWAKYSVS